ncbi:hypothetical protein GOEFS_018_00670 [Gordonia effusa NBRC 100432]|uniref:Major facilitator superfamily (MFS) profile domain-containing protein n=1 Tax=Gordonia effusa NBRC 100432 TaxID=1077974 RepID=H0QW34_9ACTN|nr:hypothetical protein [Gordonia effusa]GAB17035.1 hypothetical protein GOEFS_018_00670 [Gordonia effusa NBRC 100432]
MTGQTAASRLLPRAMWLLLVAAIIGAIVVWAAHRSDTTLTVTLFIITGIPTAIGCGLLALFVVLQAFDSNSVLRGRALGPVAVLLAFVGILAEIIAISQASHAPDPTWHYPLIAMGVAAGAAVLIVIVGVLADG